MKLKITHPTLLKFSPESSEILKHSPAPHALLSVKPGDTFEIEDEWLDESSNHICLQLKNPPEPSLPNRWFVYADHAVIEGTEPNNNPQVAPQDVAGDLPTISLPGISREVALGEKIYIGSNFTWDEATKNGDRIPPDETATQRIVKLARYLDELREKLGNHPIIVTSWYRDPATNRAVGGASRSRHLSGDAVDFYLLGLDLKTAFFKIKKLHTKGGLGIGSSFIHIDLGHTRRWYYPNGPRWELW